MTAVFRRPRLAAVLALVALVLTVPGGCRRDDAAGTSGGMTAATGARTPIEAVLLPTRHLRNNDLAAFARDAVPADLAAPLEAAWRAGRTRWPLDELPFDERIPGAMAVLSAPDAQTRLAQVYDQQFAGENTALTAAAKTLSLFGAQYVQDEGDFSAAERAHYFQLVEAAGRWAATAPLGDRDKAHAGITRLARAAAATRLTDEAAFARNGMRRSLQELSGVGAALKQVLAGYGLALDETLAGMQATQVSRSNDRAKVRMRYSFAGQPIDAVVEVERVGPYWYLSDFLRHARAAAEAPRSPGAQDSRSSEAE